MATPKEIKAEVKKLIEQIGMSNVTGGQITEIVEKLGCTHFQVEEAMDYFRYSPTQEKFRECHS